ncbi:MAG TPA: cellulase family glycosylhydrolase, partial [bacterium]|nr:cellulase family glycosylhydrolase [bacterium]
MAAPPQLKINGSTIENASTSCSVRLKGVDVSSLERNGEDLGTGPAAGGITATVAFAIQNWKCNYIRLPLNQDSWFIYDYSYRNLVDSIVNICSQNGAYVILDLHWSGLASTASTPVTGAGWLTSTGQQEMPDANSVTFWSSVAARYANNPAVLFDLYNEPNGVSGSVWRNGGSAGVFNTPGLQALLTAVRNTGANNIVIAGGLNYCQTFTGILDSGLALTDTASGNGVLYDAHIYSGNYGISTGSWNSNVATYTSAHAVMVGEFGPGPTSNINDGGAFDATFIPWLNGTGDTGNYVFSATAWSMNTTDQPNLISDWNFTPTSYHGAPVSTWLAAGGYGCAPTPGGPTYTPTATPVPASCWNLQNFTEDSFYNNTNGQWFTYDWTTASNTPVTPAMSTVSCPGGVPCSV